MIKSDNKLLIKNTLHLYFLLLKLFPFVLIILVSFSGCKTIKNGENKLLVRQTVKTDNKHLNTDEIKYIIKQKPNRKIFGFFRFHYSMYKLAGNSNSKFSSWLRNTIGEPPIFYDSTLKNMSLTQIGHYINGKGYYNYEITHKIKENKQKKIVSKYEIKSGTPYIIKNINYNSNDKELLEILLKDTVNILVKRGNVFDLSILQTERERLTNKFKSLGYYSFFEEYIKFRADTNFNNYSADIYLDIYIPSKVLVSDSTKITNPTFINKYLITNIQINTDYNIFKLDSTSYDTIVFNNIKYIFQDKYKYKPKSMSQFIMIKENENYNIKDVEETYKRLSGLNNFKNISIIFNEESDKELECKILLTRLKRQSFAIETEGTNTSNALGLAGNIVYQNINLFKGAEILRIKQKIAIEAQKLISESNSDQNEIIKSFPFNTFEAGSEVSISFPKFLLPINQQKFSKSSDPKTNFSIGINYQERMDFARYIINSTFGYEWKETRRKKHLFNPLEISSIKINRISKEFYDKILNTYDKQIANGYNDHLIIGNKYSFIYNEQIRDRLTNFRYFRFNFESAGNVLWLINNNTNATKTDKGNYTLFNIPYAQYIKADVDFRYYSYLNKENLVVFRLSGGYGIPYGNVNTLPFEKSFFSGGSNGIRAWPIRSLGPGSYNDPSNTKYDKIGEINIESNIEYRFPIYKYIKGAVFSDIGNTWLREKDVNKKNAEFNIKTFLHEMAIGVGYGIRLDFKYFVIRIDNAYAVKDPSYPIGERVRISKLKLNDFIFNLGIGYPF
ncbi:MAG: hypothetical protein A2X12_02675 [Bacteroidetes bacterium GWE2_29_8]|nr:MAG: hypothetical protein A2X12_02675 [Bacteroidetes bacterium GWE2_29_8]OFY22202.1 MAG: hypothetical protein A2X02_00045 [Bacteroidetes bacterium GWF2_29_10]